MRGYTESQALANASVLIQNGYNIGFSIDLKTKTVTCKGIYSRVGLSSVSGESGTVEITYHIPSLIIDGDAPLRVPSFAAISYSHAFTEADNQAKLNELWREEGDVCAQKCYQQINPLLAVLHEHIRVFS